MSELVIPTSDSMSLPAALAARAGVLPQDPWLFFREDYGWQWLSWAQIADRVTRAARAIGAEDGERRACPDRFDVDAVTAVLAIQAAGGVALPDADAEIVLPPIRSRVDRWIPEIPSGGSRGEDTVIERPSASAGVGDLWRAARAWDEVLPIAKGRPIVLTQAGLEGARRDVLLAWTLATGAAWVLEDDPDGFVPAVLWTRPTLVLAPGSELGLLALGLRERRPRRWHRLSAAVLVDDVPEDIYLAEDWRKLGVPVARLPA